MSAGKKQRLWQVRPCPSWCTYPHSDADKQGDRRCVSDWVTVDRHQLNAVLVANGKWRPRRTGVRLYRHAFGNLTYVEVAAEIDDGQFVEENGDGPRLCLRVSEALDIAEVIRQAACIASNEGLSPDR